VSFDGELLNLHLHPSIEDLELLTLYRTGTFLFAAAAIDAYNAPSRANGEPSVVTTDLAVRPMFRRVMGSSFREEPTTSFRLFGALQRGLTLREELRR
jgi:hypothetical protein